MRAEEPRPPHLGSISESWRGTSPRRVWGFGLRVSALVRGLSSGIKAYFGFGMYLGFVLGVGLGIYMSYGVYKSGEGLGLIWITADPGTSSKHQNLHLSLEGLQKGPQLLETAGVGV